VSLLRASDDAPPPFKWGPYIATTVVVAAVTAVGTKLGEWAVEEARAWWQKTKGTQS
jgi:hypothetical protein